MIILAGDIGGTKTWLQIAEYFPASRSEKLSVKENFITLFEQRYVSAQFSDFDLVLQVFLEAAQEEGVEYPQQGCIGVAGPVKTDATGNNTASVTNLPWQLDAQRLADRFQLKSISLVNDFQGIAFGLEMLHDDDLVVIQQGNACPAGARSTKAVIGAGTGLGQAVLVWQQDVGIGHYHVLPSEGGHGDFAPGNAVQRELISFLAGQQERVSVEDVLSGRGLVNIYRYLADKYPAEVDEDLNQAMASGDAAAEVSAAGMADENSLAHQALDLFVDIYGTQAGNFSLSCMAIGGIYIAGGIAAKIHPCFTTGAFLAAYQNKGPMQALMKTIPVRLVLDPQVGLKGAALSASRL